MTRVFALDNPNVAMVELTAYRLGDLCDELVFVGGCATDLLVTVARAQQSRATDDVDVVTSATTIRGYHVVESQLEVRGFRRDTSPDAPICRWISEGIVLDLMPSGPGVLGFHNPWYPLAIETAVGVSLPSGRLVRLIRAPEFIATKLEAFEGRGNADFLASHDLEDIVTVIDGRESLLDEVSASQRDLRDYLAQKFSALIATNDFLDALAGHLRGDAASQARLPELERRVRLLATSSKSTGR